MHLPPANALEPEQHSAHLEQPVARAHLSTTTHVALWALRIVVLCVTAMVVYAFVAQLV